MHYCPRSGGFLPVLEIAPLWGTGRNCPGQLEVYGVLGSRTPASPASEFQQDRVLVKSCHIPLKAITYWVTSNKKGLTSSQRFTSYREAFSKKFKNWTTDRTLPKRGRRGDDPLLTNTLQRLARSPSSQRHLTPVVDPSALSTTFPVVNW